MSGGFAHGGRHYEYAGVGRRALAALLDNLVWLLGILFLPIPPGWLEDHPEAGAVLFLAILTLWFNYFAICEWRLGQTIGKNATGLRVLRLDGRPLGWNAAAVRNLMRLLDAPLFLLGPGILIMSRSARRQRLGDRAARTIVVREAGSRVQEEAAPGGAAGAGGSPAPAPPGPTAGEIFADGAAALAAQAPSQPQPVPQGGAAGGEAGEPAAAQPRPPRRLPAVTWGAGWALGGALLAILAGIFIAIPVLVADPEAGSDEGSVAGNVGAQLATLAGFVLVSFAVAARGERRVRLGLLAQRLGLRGFRPSAFGWMLLAYIGYVAFAAAYAGLVTVPEQEDIAPLFGPLASQILLIVVGASICEEVAFRGLLYGGLRTALGIAPAALTSGVVFGALHAFSGVTAVPPLIALGIVLALLYERTGSIVPGIILHAANNSLALAFAS